MVDRGAVITYAYPLEFLVETDLLWNRSTESCHDATLPMHHLKHGAVCLITGKNDPRIFSKNHHHLRLLCLSVLKHLLFQHMSYPTRREKTPIYMNLPASRYDSSVSRRCHLPQNMPAANRHCATASPSDRLAYTQCHSPPACLRLLSVFSLPFNTEGSPHNRLVMGRIEDMPLRQLFSPTGGQIQREAT